MIIVISACSQQQGFACNQPYIQVGSQCCLDQNDNKICDSDEPTKPQTSNLSENTNTSKNQTIAQPTPVETKTSEPEKSKATVNANVFYGDVNGSRLDTIYEYYGSGADYYLWILNTGNDALNCRINYNETGAVFSQLSQDGFVVKAKSNYSKSIFFAPRRVYRDTSGFTIQNREVNCSVGNDTKVFNPQIELKYWWYTYEYTDDATQLNKVVYNPDFSLNIEVGQMVEFTRNGVKHQITLAKADDKTCTFDINAGDVVITLKQYETGLVYGGAIKIGVGKAEKGACDFIIFN